MEFGMKLLRKTWMLSMEVSGILVALRHRQNFSFREQIADERDAGRCACFSKAVWQNHGGMAGQIADQQRASAKRRRDEKVDLFEHCSHVLDEQITNALRLEEFDRRNESPSPKRVRPRIRLLLFE